MLFQRLLVGLVDYCRRHGLLVVLGGLALAGFAGVYAAHHLGISTDTDEMFARSLPWRQRALAFKAEFPQFSDLLVAVIDAKEPEQAEATAAGLAAALAADHVHFRAVSRPDSSPFLNREGLLFLDTKQLAALLEQTIDAQPFLGQLAKDPSARGLFAALALLGKGVQQGQVDLSPYQTALAAFHQAIADAIAGHPHPLSWTRLIGGKLADLGGPYKFVLAQPRLDNGVLEPGGAATAAIRAAANKLEFVKSGAARVRITGNVALSDEEFASVAKGAVAGMIGSVLLISLWLFLAVRTWRLIVPILLTLGLGLMLTLLFAAAAVGTLNLVSVGFGILFVGIAVDFAIQFCVRYREMRWENPDHGAAMAETGRRVGGQILVAAAATSAGFLAFVPTEFRGVAELGLIAGVGMLIAFLCTITFLPAAISLFRPRAESASVGFGWAAPLDEIVRRHRRPLLVLFAALAVLGVALLPQLRFDSNPLHTKNPHTEAMRTLSDLMDSPVTNPFTIDLLTANAAAAAPLSERLRELPLVSGVLSIDSFLPKDQKAKLAQIEDAATLLGPTLSPPAPVPPPTAQEIRTAAKKCVRGDRAGIDQIIDRSAAGRYRRRSAQGGGRARSGGAGHEPGTDPLFASAARSAAHCALGRTGDLAEHSAGVGPRLGSARRSGPHPGLAQVRGERQPRIEGFRRSSQNGRPECRWPGSNHRGEQRHDRRVVPLGRAVRCGRDCDHFVRRIAPRPRRIAGSGAVAAVVADDGDRHGPATAAAELREHHRAALAAGCRRLVQHLLRDELARWAGRGAWLGHRSRDLVLGADHGHRIRHARAVAASGDGEHGHIAADQPRLHPRREPCLHSGAAGVSTKAKIHAGRAVNHRPP